MASRFGLRALAAAAALSWLLAPAPASAATISIDEVIGGDSFSVITWAGFDGNFVTNSQSDVLGNGSAGYQTFNVAVLTFSGSWIGPLLGVTGPANAFMLEPNTLHTFLDEPGVHYFEISDHVSINYLGIDGNLNSMSGFLEGDNESGNLGLHNSA